MYSVLYKYRCHLELLMLLTWGRISSLGVPYTETSSRLWPGPALARLLGVNLTRGSPASASIAASPSSRWRVSSHRGRSTPAVREDQIIAVSGVPRMVKIAHLTHSSRVGRTVTSVSSASRSWNEDNHWGWRLEVGHGTDHCGWMMDR